MIIVVEDSLVKLEINKKDLLDGRKYDLSNVAHEDSIQIEYSRSLCGNSHFKIWMNGSIIHMVKTYQSSMKKVKELAEKYELNFESSSY